MRILEPQENFQEENIMEERLQTLLNEKFGKNLDNCSQAELFQALMSLTKEETQKLPKNQGKLLVALLSGGDALVTTEQLCIALWGTTEYIDENALQVNLTRLKKTMSGLEMKQRIVAVRGMGYRLEAEVSL